MANLRKLLKKPSHGKAIKALHDAGGGSTYNLKHGDMSGKDLYAVAVHPDRAAMIPGQPTEEHLNDFVNKNKDLLASGEHSVGTWFDPEVKATILDVVAALPDQKQALQLGKVHNQKYIFHLGTKKTIPVT